MTKFRFNIQFECECENKEDAEEYIDAITDEFYEPSIKELHYYVEDLE